MADKTVHVGSSPRVWGTQLPGEERFERTGKRPVHPHVCGEHKNTDMLNRYDLDRRFIPTCVGNTIRFIIGSCRHMISRFIPTCVGKTNF